jgi:methylornithine synthase
MAKAISSFKLEEVLKKACERHRLSKEEIIFLLGLKEVEEINQLFHRAQSLRQRYFGDKIFLYGFIYFSTYCRNQCTFCIYRAPNRLCQRYRKGESEIMEIARELAESGVHLIDLTMGEDPFYYQQDDGFKSLLELIGKVKEETGLPVMVSPGVIPKHVLVSLADMDIDWYACYQETHNRQLFRYLRPNQSYDSRLEEKYLARELGLLVEEGILAGVGESRIDVAASMQAMRDLGAYQVRVMSFIPQRGSPMSSWPSPPRIYEMIIIAILRLLFPDRLIPASLDIDGVEGLQERLKAGANVVTSLIPAHMGLAGVAQASLDIDGGYRTVKGVLSILEELGLRAAKVEDYGHWIRRAKNGLVKQRICSGIEK